LKGRGSDVSPSDEQPVPLPSDLHYELFHNKLQQRSHPPEKKVSSSPLSRDSIAKAHSCALLLFSRWVKLLTGISAGFGQESFGLFGLRIPTNGHLLESWAENGRSMFGFGERV
jgi:hypothetical protein